ncbi:unnamed protein product [Lactuca virosa]|uniref:Uncharacterized protein n=1 Tax=Lactuca virosa TaxID=75947 RepID=A0AAU9NSN6_9ASTR|nr:unnamed protein product [Lactuca virosa]
MDVNRFLQQTSGYGREVVVRGEKWQVVYAKRKTETPKSSLTLLSGRRPFLVDSPFPCRLTAVRSQLSLLAHPLSSLLQFSCSSCRQDLQTALC